MGRTHTWKSREERDLDVRDPSPRLGGEEGRGVLLHSGHGLV